MTALYQQILTSETAQGIDSSLRSDGPSAPPDKNISDYRIGVKPGGGGLGYLRVKYSESLRILMAVVGLVLLIACSNVANLLLARAASRRSEIGLRLALGSGRFRLMRQLLTESVLLALLGGAAGLLVAYWLGDALGGFHCHWLDADIAPDFAGRAGCLAFTTISLLRAAFLFGLVPAWQATQLDIGTALKGSSRTQTAGRPRQRFSRALLVSQVAFVACCCSLAPGCWRAASPIFIDVDPGFRLQNVLILEVHMEDLERIQGKPDFAVAAEAAAGTATARWRRGSTLSPVCARPAFRGSGLFGDNDLYTSLIIAGAPARRRLAHVNMVSSRYFETVGMQVVHGPRIRPARRASAPPRVMVINETMARRYFGGTEPAREGGGDSELDELKDTPFEIVGVLRDAKYNDLRAPVEPMFYLPLAQAPYPIQSVEVQTAGDPLAIAASR